MNDAERQIAGHRKSGWLVPLGAVILLAVGQCWSAYEEYHQTVANEFRLLSSNVRIATAQTEVLLRELAFSLNETVGDRRAGRMAAGPEYQETLAARMKELGPGIRSLVYIDAHGRVEYSATSEIINADLSAHDYFQTHRGSVGHDGLYASRPYKTGTGDYGIAVSMADRMADGILRGVAVAELNAAFFDDIIRSVVPDGNGNATLFNQYGDILNRHPGMASLIGTSGAGEPFKAHRRSGNSLTAIIGTSIVDGVRRAIVFGDVPGTSLIVNAARPMRDVMAGWVWNSAARAAFVAISSIMILFMVWSAMRRRLRSDEMSQALERAEAVNRERTLFLASMSHEFRTPLNAINGYSEGIALGVFGSVDNPKVLDYINDINRAGTHLLHLVEDVLDLSSIELGKFNANPEMVDVCYVLSTARAMIGPTAYEKNLVTETQCSPENLMMFVDHRRLVQVLTNLLGNAVKFTPNGGRIRLSAQQLEGAWVQIEIEDNGIGMDVKEQVQALTLFGQPDPNVARRSEGRGIGLPLSKYLVEAMGGRFTIDSHPGQGTCIRIVMPQAVSQSQDNDGARDEASEPLAAAAPVSSIA